MRFLATAIAAAALLGPLALPGPSLAASADEAAEAAIDAVGPFPAAGQVLADRQWLSRVIVVFSDTPADPSFVRQMELLSADIPTLALRDVVILTDTDPASGSDARQTLRPRGFALVIVDKDGRVMLRKPSPWHVREIVRAIDKTPLRQQELAERGNRLAP